MNVKPLSLYLLGTPRLVRGGKPVEFDTRKATALLAYLAVTQTAHTRDALAALLYPESVTAKARAALRRTLSALKQAVKGDWLEVDRETIGLNPAAGLWVDVNQFRSRLERCKQHGHGAGKASSQCLASLESAVELYRGDFMAGFTLRDSPQFDDWQLFQTESLQRDLVDVLGRLVCCQSIRGEYERAVDFNRRWLALDPLDEPAHRQLMRLYAWTGQRTAALRQYRECVRFLEQELGVAPLEETTELYQAVESNRLPPPGTTEGGQRTMPSILSVSPPGSLPFRFTSLASYPLVGRSAQLAALADAYDSVRVDGHFVILEGEAGIGKTRLAEELLASLQARGAVTITARCYEGETNLAYGPFVEGLRALDLPADRLAGIPSQVRSLVARLLPELELRAESSMESGQALPPAPAMDSPEAQGRFFESMSQVLLAACGRNPPGVLFLDDVQWADAASLDLLTWLVRRLHGRPLFVLAAWRSEQVAADHRLRQLLAEGRRAGTATFVHLSRLDRDAVAELVQAAQSGASQDLAERLYRETEGQPFFLIEYLALLRAGEQAESAEWSLPGGVRDLLRSHLNRVSETARQLLGAAAVIGRSFDFEIVRETSGRNDLETVTALEELMAQGLIAEVKTASGGSAVTYDFTHEKLRELVYEETSLARRRLLHRRVAESFVNRGRLHRETEALANQIARHYQLAGEETLAADYFKRAGEYARSLYANAEALEHFRAALALGYLEAAWLHEAMGDLQTLLGQYGAALNSYEAAAARREAKETGRVEAKIANVYLRRGDWELAEHHFQAASSALGDSAPAGLRARIYGDWSLAALRRGSTEQARDLAQRALELAEAVGDQRALTQVHNILGILARHRDDLDEALAHLEKSLALAESQGDVGARSAALNNLSLVHQDRGDVARGLELSERALTLSASQGDRHREAAIHNNMADLLHAAGQSEEAMAHLKQAVAIYAEIGVEAGIWQPEIWKLSEW